MGFDEFSPSQEATNHLLEIDEKQKSEEVEPDCLELNNSSRDDTDMYLNELGDDIREIGETPVFTPNVYWRSAHNLVNQTDWANPSVKVATATPSSNVRMQQGFDQEGLEPPPYLHKNAKTNSATFCERQSPQSEVLCLNEEKNMLTGLFDWTDEHEATLHSLKRESANYLPIIAGEQLLKLLFGREFNEPSSCILNAMPSPYVDDCENWID